MTTPEPTPEAVEALAALLARHRPNAWRWGCDCNQMPGATYETHQSEHREHVARAVLAAGYVKRELADALIDECTRGRDPVQQSLAYEFRDALDGTWKP